MVLADTGFWLALLWQRDCCHALARQAFERYRGDGLICTWPVLSETCYMLGRALGEEAKAAFLDSVAAGAIEIHAASLADCARMATLVRRYANLPMDLADASLVLLAEHLGHGRILSTDLRDFEAYRWKNREPFQNLMFPDA